MFDILLLIFVSLYLIFCFISIYNKMKQKIKDRSKMNTSELRDDKIDDIIKKDNFWEKI